MFYEVLPGKKVGRALDALTYSFDSPLSPGTLVEIPLGRAKIPGLVLKKVAQPDFPTKPISKILYSTPLPPHLLAATRFIADYYLEGQTAALSAVLPVGLLKSRRKPKIPLTSISAPLSLSNPQSSPSLQTANIFPTAKTPSKTEQIAKIPKIPLNLAQKTALKAIQTAPETTRLLLGVTGSGKTNIYLEMAKNALKREKSTILLVPEIALTGQLVRVFSDFFGENVALIHSNQTEAKRHLLFEQLLNASTPKIVIGPRSALFAPLKDLGLIIIDEAHESTYYQENSPKYSALRVASFMAKALKIPCILGSATPNITDFYLAKRQKSLILLTEKAKTTAIPPEITIVDFKNRDNFSKNRYFSQKLLSTIEANLAAGAQTLIFHNRRGSAPLTLCETCGEEITCPNCFLPLTLHSDTYTLVCHTCNFKTKVPTICPHCKTPGTLIHKGFGTKLLETELSRLFKTARIRRFDADNKKGESLAVVYDEVKNGSVDILIGTQTLAKGLDLPKLATVGIVQADAGLSLPDFSAEERTFDLLTQVIGRVGRGHQDKAEVIIQTFRPDHPVLNFAINSDFLGFSDYLLARRREATFPPFTFLMKCELTLKTEAFVLQKIRSATRSLQKDPTLLVSPPMPAFHEHTEKGYTWQIIVRSRSRSALLSAANSLGDGFKFTLDPPSLL